MCSGVMLSFPIVMRSGGGTFGHLGCDFAARDYLGYLVVVPVE